MSSLRSGPAGAGPVLVVRTRQSDHRLHAGTSYRLGRDPGSDIVLSDTRVSWRHATLRHEQDTWILEDVGSTNGTFIGTRRVDRITISSDCVIRLGNPEDGPVLRCEPAARPVHAPTEISTPAASVALDGEPGTAVLDDGAVQDPPRDLRHDAARDVRRAEGRPAAPASRAPGSYVPAPGAPAPAPGSYVPGPHVPDPRVPGPGGNGAPGGHGGNGGNGRPPWPGRQRRPGRPRPHRPHRPQWAAAGASSRRRTTG